MSDLPEPITREEMFLSAVAGESATLPAPVTREELFLAKAAGENVITPEPVTRREMFLDAIAAGGGVTVEPLSVSENGTYTAPEGVAYSPVTVNTPVITLRNLTVNRDGTYSAPTGTAYSSVSVSVRDEYTVDLLPLVQTGQDTYRTRSGRAVFDSTFVIMGASERVDLDPGDGWLIIEGQGVSAQFDVDNDTITLIEGNPSLVQFLYEVFQ